MIGHAIRFVREKRNMTQSELGELIGSGRSYVSQLESGKVNPGPKKLKQICDALNVEIDIKRMFKEKV